jgi:P2 family phage contractile tail tube protein
MSKIPLIPAQFAVYPDGKTEILGIGDLVIPQFAAMAETLTGAGFMGELEHPVRGAFTAMEFVMNFRILYGDPLTFGVTEVHHFDCRVALETTDRQTFDRGVANERWSIRGPIKSINPGTRAPSGNAGASIAVAAYRIEHYMEGRQVLEVDVLNQKYIVNGKDLYAAIKAAIS